IRREAAEARAEAQNRVGERAPAPCAECSSLDPSESFAFARGWVRRFARNVRGRSPRTLAASAVGGGCQPCGHGRESVRAHISTRAAKPGFAWSSPPAFESDAARGDLRL